MTTPRWFLIAAGLLVVNAAAVVTTGYWRFAGADEPSSANLAIAPGPVDAHDQQVVAEVENAVGTPASAKPANPLDAIPIPDSMPEIPSLSDPEALQDDPGFQEFRRLFASEEESWNAEPPLLRKGQAGAPTATYFQALDQRLETVEKLCSAARSIASDAARQARDGSQNQSEELVRMATQIRDIAAKLLVSEL